MEMEIARLLARSKVEQMHRDAERRRASSRVARSGLQHRVMLRRIGEMMIGVGIWLEGTAGRPRPAMPLRRPVAAPEPIPEA